MRVFIRLAIFFYLLVISVVGFTALLVLAHVVDLDRCLDVMRSIYDGGRSSTIAAVIIAATLLISLAFARIIYGRQEQERLIHFDNSLGRVTISLSAIEDLVRRLVVHAPQIKEIRPNIVSNKKGLNIEIRLVLRSDVNIPEMTAELQTLIQRKVQAIIGSDEKVNIRVHVIKIVADDEKKGKSYVNEDVGVAGQVPFHGYRA